MHPTNRSVSTMIVAALLALLLVVPPRFALAQSPADRAAARVLFDEGVKLLQAGQTPEACKKFEASLARMSGVGTRGKLAECYERLGRTASAWALWREVAAMSKRAGDKPRTQAAEAKAAALEERLPRLTISLAAAGSGVVVQVDGRTLAPAELEVALPMDPGAHEIVATRGDKGFTQSITLKDGEAERVRVTFPDATQAPAPEPEPEPAREPAPAPQPEPEPEPAPEPESPPSDEPLVPVTATDGAAPAHSSGRRTIGWTLVGLGAAGLATCGVLSYLAVQSDKDGDTDKAISQANLATAFVIGGSVLAATGFIVVLTAPKAGGGGVALVPSVGPSGGGLVLVGGF